MPHTKEHKEKIEQLKSEISGVLPAFEIIAKGFHLNLHAALESVAKQGIGEDDDDEGLLDSDIATQVAQALVEQHGAAQKRVRHKPRVHSVA